ncbi:hypothetical protein QZH46_10075 [Pseudomonas corrugata]
MALTSLHSHAEGIEVVTEDSLYAYLRDGKLVGPGTRVVEQTLDKAELTDHHILLYPWARAYDKALHEPNVLIYPMDRTVLREPLFKWVGELERVTIKLYKLRERHDITLSNLEDAKLYTVGVVRNDSKQLLMHNRDLPGWWYRRIVAITSRNCSTVRSSSCQCRRTRHGSSATKSMWRSPTWRRSTPSMNALPGSSWPSV